MAIDSNTSSSYASPPTVDSVTIQSSTFSFLLRSASSATGDSDGLLLGRFVSHASPTLSDDSSPDIAAPLCSASIAAFLSLSTPSSLSNPLGHVDLSPYGTLSLPVIGFFAFRRCLSASPARPSMREAATALSLAKTISAPTVIFLLLSYPERMIHTHEYRAYTVSSTGAFSPVSVKVLNLGPAFREQYLAFQVASPLPELSLKPVDMKGKESIAMVRRVAKDQMVLDRVAEGLKVEKVEKMVVEGTNAGSEMEEMYTSMLKKLVTLVKKVEKGSAAVLEEVVLCVLVYFDLFLVELYFSLVFGCVW